MSQVVDFCGFEVKRIHEHSTDPEWHEYIREVYIALRDVVQPEFVESPRRFYDDAIAFLNYCYKNNVSIENRCLISLNDVWYVGWRLDSPKSYPPDNKWLEELRVACKKYHIPLVGQRIEYNRFIQSV